MKPAPDWRRIGAITTAALGMVAAVVLGVTGVIGDDSATRLVLGCLALAVAEGRKTPPSGPAAVVLAVTAGELGATALQLTGVST